MEFLIEIILEITIEGVFVTATAKRVPVPLRVLAGILALGIFGGVIFLMIYLGIITIQNPEFRNGKFVSALMFIGAVALFIGLVYRIVQFIQRR